MTAIPAALSSSVSAPAHRLALQANFGHDLAHNLGAILAYALVGAALIAVGFVIVDLTTPGKLNELVREGMPNAVAIAIGGTLAVSLIVVTSIFSSGGHLAEGLITTASYGLLGILVQVCTVRLLEYVLRIDVGRLLHEDEYNPASLAVAAAHVAMGLIVAISVT
ncbi:MAG: hypothetical protein QOE71_3401 [Pseudonocardiales bacterium]|nr:hypothetical protein [Pseudonocardiales bacterium]